MRLPPQARKLGVLALVGVGMNQAGTGSMGVGLGTVGVGMMGVVPGAALTAGDPGDHDRLHDVIIFHDPPQSLKRAWTAFHDPPQSRK